MLQLKLDFDEKASIDELRKILRTHTTEIKKRRAKNSDNDEDELLYINDKPEFIDTMAENANNSRSGISPWKG